MKANKPYEYRSKIKWVLAMGWIVLFSASLFYTNSIIDTLKKENRKNLLFQLQTYERAINSSEDEESGYIFTEIIQDAIFPIILTDADGNITSWRNIDGIPDTLIAMPQVLAQLKERLQEMNEEHDPVEIRYNEFILARFHYGEEPLIGQLRLWPIIQGLIITAFILLGYFGFSAVRTHEHNLMWIGLAKETAHQMGTPLSSLMGWTTLLKEEKGIPQKPLREIEKDIDRLQVVANRFSKIGSEPKLVRLNFSELMAQVESYYQKRLPQMGTNINLSLKQPPDIYVRGNKDLLSWVIENMIKNAIDAMDKKEGKIELDVREKDKTVVILVIDNGIGMSGKVQTNIFNPGYSTKKRGWGLGLTLVKRIIESYHNGNVTILESTPRKGTTFEIVLPEEMEETQV